MTGLGVLARYREHLPITERTPMVDLNEGSTPLVESRNIGPAPRHKGLWLAFGHQHLGFTLGPVTGRLLAEMMTGEPPFTDPGPYRAERFS